MTKCVCSTLSLQSRVKGQINLAPPVIIPLPHLSHDKVVPATATISGSWPLSPGLSELCDRLYPKTTLRVAPPTIVRATAGCHVSRLRGHACQSPESDVSGCTAMVFAIVPQPLPRGGHVMCQMGENLCGRGEGPGHLRAHVFASYFLVKDPENGLGSPNVRDMGCSGPSGSYVLGHYSQRAATHCHGMKGSTRMPEAPCHLAKWACKWLRSDHCLVIDLASESNSRCPRCIT